jgi:hypothetical protein
MRALLIALACGASAALLAAQKTDVERPATDRDRQAIRIRGCVKDRTVRDVAGGAFGPAGTIYRLNGSKTVLATLKEHNGHEDAIEGTIRVAGHQSHRTGKEKTVGKARVYAGGSSSHNTGGPVDVADPTIDVLNVEHLDRKCLAR